MLDSGPHTDQEGQVDALDKAPELLCKHVCVLLSGGVDSSACVGYYVSRGYEVCALFIDYGQINAEEEAAAAKAVSKHYGLALLQVQVSGPQIPSGYVPARNAVLIALALMSTDLNTGLLAIGIHADTPYVDCSAGFVRSMQRIVDLYTGGCIRIDAPFINWTKGEICDYAQKKGVPLHLAFSSNPEGLPSNIIFRHQDER